MKRLLLLTSLLLTPLLLPAQAMPRLEGKALSGQELVLPDAGHGHVALILFGFSKESGKYCKTWGTRFVQDYTKDPKVEAFTVAEMQGIPGFIKGMVVGSIRRDTPESYRGHFVPLFDGRQQWQNVVGFQSNAGDDAYLLLLDGTGVIRWRAHGRFNEALYTQLKQQVAKLESGQGS